jgi:hypothetical protein
MAQQVLARETDFVIVAYTRMAWIIKDELSFVTVSLCLNPASCEFEESLETASLQALVISANGQPASFGMFWGRSGGCGGRRVCRAVWL